MKLSGLSAFLQSKAHWTGSAAAGAACAAAALGAVGSGWPAAAALSYAFGFALGRQIFPRPHAGLEDFPGQSAGAASGALLALDNLEADIRAAKARLGAENHAQCLACASACRQVIQSLDPSRPGLADPAALGQACRIANDYLPGLVRGFLAIPEAYAARPMGEGPAPCQILADKLSVLLWETRKLAEKQAQDDAAGFMRHAKFLEEKFPPGQGIFPEDPR